jgi:DNA gyrase subunit A
MLALDNGLPKTMNIKQMMQAWVDHRIEVVRRRTRYELNKAEARAHILEGYLKALDHLDEIVKMIRQSSDRHVARVELIQTYHFSERQADAILELRLYQLTGLEREKIENEYKDLIQKIEHLRAILADEKLVRGIIKDELADIERNHKGIRATKIVAAEGELQMEDLIPNETVVITISSDDYIKRMPIDTFREQKRGGSGVIGADLKKETDAVKDVYIVDTHDTLLVFTNLGRCYWLKVWQVPEGNRRSKGKPLINLLEGLTKDERIAAILNIKSFEDPGAVIFATKQGTIKKTLLDAYSSPRKKGVYAIAIDDGDEVIAARLVHPGEQVMLFTRDGMAVRFDEDRCRPMGRVARGVRGVTLKDKEDFVVSCEVVKSTDTLLLVCENGFGKRSDVEEFRHTNRGGKGVRAIMINKRNGYLVAALRVDEKDGILMMSEGGQTLRTSIKDIRVMGRSTQGVTLVNLGVDDKLVAVQRISEGEESGI